MASEWREAALGDIVELKRGYDLPQQNRVKGTIPIVSSSGISDYHSVSKVNGPGVVTGRYGTIGEVFYIRESFWPLNTTLYVRDFKGNDPRFVSYLMLTVNFLAYSDKAAVPGVNRNHLHAERVCVPTDVGEQRAIGVVLGTLDDKIELNGRMNETLGGITRALFESWFVDFDPVRAKVEANNSDLPKPIAELIPGSFEATELGYVPKGWEIRSLGDVCLRVSMGPFGSDIKTDNFLPVGVPVVRGGNLRDGFVDDRFVFLSEEKATELKNANAFPGDIVITHRGTLGQVGIIPRKSRFPRYVVSQSQMVLSVDPNKASPEFVFNFLCSKNGQHQLLANTSQTGVPAIARPTNSVKAIRIVLPPAAILRVFDGVVGRLSERRNAARVESRTLIALRNELLPKLVSGKLRIPDAERIVGRQV
jgi:type I restriction enzyme S subunit